MHVLMLFLFVLSLTLSGCFNSADVSPQDNLSTTEVGAREVLPVVTNQSVNLTTPKDTINHLSKVLNSTQ